MPSSRHKFVEEIGRSKNWLRSGELRLLAHERSDLWRDCPHLGPPRLVLVSARGPLGVGRVADEIAGEGFAICSNGALVLDLGSRSVIRHRMLAADISVQIVRDVGGMLTAKNNPSGGATLRVSFPVPAETPGRTEE